MPLDRRRFLAGGAALLATATTAGTEIPAIPILDTHIHLFDASRPQGAPYAGPPEYTTHIARPESYRAAAKPLGVVGAIAIEASPWIEDNLWLLETAQTDSLVVGVIGNLRPEQPDFAALLARFAKNPLFRGIRYGNLWGYDLASASRDPAFLSGLKRLADAGLVLDTANPRPELLEAIMRISDAVPDLRIVIDHLPALDPTADMLARYEAALSDLKTRPNVSAKLSEIYHKREGAVVSAPRERLDRLLEVFGGERVLFGSDWPNSVGTATLPQIVGLARDYIAGKPRDLAENFFWKNSARIYRWDPRASDQPQLI